MNHEMHLLEEPFELIKSGKKVIEVRLFDEKRQKVRIGDEIRFIKSQDNNETIKVRVIGISRFNNFFDLYSSFDKSQFGSPEHYTVEDQVKDTRKTYPEEKEKRFGVLGIHIKKIC
ncbi:MAG: ASCH domain-containing protein [Nanoarchaeota archaeon]|nr:ASCH domain-containing protein [Nanoarchaeota archaeon]